MSVLKTAKLKIKIATIGLIGRVLIVVSVFLFTRKGYFRHDTFRELICIMLPLAGFYITLFVRYIFRMAYQYPVKGRLAGKDEIGFGYYGLLLLNIAELFFIIYNAVAVDEISPLFAGNFIFCILFAEIAFGLIAGFYIADLFGIHNTNTAD